MKKRLDKTNVIGSMMLLVMIGVLIFVVFLQPIEAVEDGEIWFDDVNDPVQLSEQDGLAIISQIAQILLEDEDVAIDLPDDLEKNETAQIVFLSLSDGESTAFVFAGRGEGLLEALEAGVELAKEEIVNGLDAKWLKVDFVSNVFPFPILDDLLVLERSLFGMAYEREYGISFLPEEMMANTLINSKQELRIDHIEEYLERGLNEYQMLPESFEEVLPIYRFSTISFFHDGNEGFGLYRGHRMFETFSADDLMESSIAGGEYLIQNVDENGFFNYSYFPKENYYAEDYNYLRHAGTIYAMVSLYEKTEDPVLLDAIQRSFDHLIGTIHICPMDGGAAGCVSDEGEVKVGGNGLALLAFSRYIDVTGDMDYLEVAQSLAKWILLNLEENGDFIAHKYIFPRMEETDFVSYYYPGEALYGLTQLYLLDGNEEWLDAAEKIAFYVIDERDGGLTDEELYHDHWLLLGLNHLYRQRPEPLYINHTARLSKAIGASQNLDPWYPDWVGSYYDPPRSTPTATRAEGLCAAYLLLDEYDMDEEAAAVLETYKKNVSFELGTQFRPESVLYLKEPLLAIGGFHRSLTNYEVRIDYVQHNMSSLICLAEILEEIE